METSKKLDQDLSSMSPADKKNALTKMRQDLEEQFVELGQLLYEVKNNSLHVFFGYPTFKEFIEDEFNMSGSLASKLISNYKFYLQKLNLDEESYINIGLEKLNQLRPILKEADRIEQEDWLKKAQEQKSTILKEEIKEFKEKDKKKNIQDVFTDQFLERMVSHFNCNRKELMFKLALFFQDKDMAQIEEEIRKGQAKMRQEEFKE